jgi:hypothetical protein
MEYVQLSKNRYAQVRVKADGSKYFIQNVCGVNKRIKLRSKNPRKLHSSPLPSGSRTRKMSGRGRSCSGKKPKSKKPKSKSKKPKKKTRSPKKQPKTKDILNLMDLPNAQANPFDDSLPPSPARSNAPGWWNQV